MQFLYHDAIAAPARARIPTDPALDGRVARGERTRRQLAEALISLLEEGETRPTARATAARAGVSPRLVFHHFADMESILREAVAVQSERHWRRLGPVDAGLPLSERIDLLVSQRARLFDAVAPVRRAAMAREDASNVLADELRRSRRGLRRQLEATFAPELRRAARRRERLVDALELATSFESWEQLRRTMGLGHAAAVRVTADLVAAALNSTDTGGGR